MSLMQSALASRLPAKKLLYSNLIFSSDFTSNLLQSNVFVNETANYVQFTRQLTGADSVTGDTWPTSLATIMGANVSSYVEMLSNYVGIGMTTANAEDYIKASILPSFGSFGYSSALEVRCLQSNGAPGGTNASQATLQISRPLQSGLPAPDIPEIYFEFFMQHEDLLGTNLIYPTVNGNDNWKSFFAIKGGHGNDGAGGAAQVLAGDWRLGCLVLRDPADGVLKYRVRMDDRGNNSAITIPGVTSTNRIIRPTPSDILVPGVTAGDWIKVKVYIKRPLNNADRTTGICWISVTPDSTGIETVICDLKGGEQMGVQSCPMTRFFFIAYSGGLPQYYTRFSKLRIYDGYPYNPDTRTSI